MKENAKKILLFLYTSSSDSYYFATAPTLRIAVPDLSDSGYRSLLTLLKHRSLITIENRLGESQYRITTNGTKALKTALPGLAREDTQWQGKWAVLIFKQAPTGDQQFRYLRTLLVKYQSLALARGVYLYPDSFPLPVQQEIESRYGTSVSLFEVEKWLSDDERQIAIEHYHLSDLAEGYSGVSSEIERLINTKRGDNNLNQQDKLHISSLFSRLYEMMTEDMGMLRYYFPQATSGVEVLARIQAHCRS